MSKPRITTGNNPDDGGYVSVSELEAAIAATRDLPSMGDHIVLDSAELAVIRTLVGFHLDDEDGDFLPYDFAELRRLADKLGLRPAPSDPAKAAVEGR